jgi:hypothetical protein
LVVGTDGRDVTDIIRDIFMSAEEVEVKGLNYDDAVAEFIHNFEVEMKRSRLTITREPE